MLIAFNPRVCDCSLTHKHHFLIHQVFKRENKTTNKHVGVHKISVDRVDELVKLSMNNQHLKLISIYISIIYKSKILSSLIKFNDIFMH